MNSSGGAGVIVQGSSTLEGEVSEYVEQSADDENKGKTTKRGARSSVVKE